MAFDAMFKPFAKPAAAPPNRTARRAAVSAPLRRPQRPEPYRWRPGGQADRITAWTAATVRMRGLSSSPPPDPGDDLTSGPGTSVGTDYQFAPVLRDRELYRTTLVAQGEDFIDLQTEVAIPVSPTATGWTVGGTDVDYFEISNGQIYLKAATRGSISKPATLSLTVTATNSYGTSTTVALTVKIPADADCRFCSYVSGSDSNNGTTPALAWKRCPGATGYTGSAVTLGAGKVLFFKAEPHRYSLHGSSYSYLDHAGSSGNPMVYALSGWGGRAAIDGSDAVTGWTTVTQAEVGGNTNYANIKKLDLTAGSNGGAMAAYQHMFAGDVMLYPAQSPTPTDLWNFEGTTDVTESSGMWRLQVSTSTGVSPRISQSGTTITIVDTRIAAVFGSNDPTGWYLPIWVSGNNMSRAVIASYNQGTSTITATLASGSIQNASGYCAYSISHHPCQIVEAGQFALSANGQTLYAWLPNADTTSVARRNRGMALGSSYVTVEGGTFQRFVGETGGGMAIVAGSGVTMTNTTVRDHIIRQCRADGGEGLIHGSGTTWDECNIERIALLDYNPHASGVRLGSPSEGYANGTATQVRNHAWGKIRWVYCAPASIGRTFIFATRNNGIHIYENCARDLNTVHGNCISLYGDAADAYSDHTVVENNFMDNCVRGYTVSMDAAILGNPRSNTICRNIFLGNGDGDGYVVAMYSGEPDSVFEQNIIMGATGWDYPQACSIGIGSRVTVQNNWAAGYAIASPQSDCTYTCINNVTTISGAVPPNDGSTRVSTGNTVASGAPIKVWDRTISSAMATTLGPGQIGIFWNIAA